MDNASDHEASDQGLQEQRANEQADLDNVVSRVAERFPTVDRERVESVVGDEAEQLDGARVRDYIPVLVEHEAVDRLREEADPVSLAERQEGGDPDHDPALHSDGDEAPESGGPLLGGMRGGN